ncbi:hypothetical protein SDC9_113126 [bioreactor metagenome]|uniref:GGDEF domain-containing protein n=1 Tax=bioreactor metagenome TaxID=1076179 RepID=A0A645BL83_9ZZZZ
MLFDDETVKAILAAYYNCQETRSSADTLRIRHITTHSLVEYFEFKFVYTEGSGTVAFIRNITESVLIEEEFTSMSEQYESVNRELCVAMTNLDFHLMDIEQAHKKVAALYRITSIVQRTVNEREVLEEILDGITRELNFNNVALMLLDERTNELKITAFRGELDASIKVPVGKGIAGSAAQGRELIYVENVNNDPRYIESGKNCISEVAVPLIVQDKVVGVLNIDIDDGRTLQSYDLDLLRSLASQIAMTIAHASHVAKVELQAITDGLTGLYNYRYFRAMLDQELKRSIRYNRPLSLIMIDVDHFKHYNDNNGHRAGDEALCIVASLIRSCCRDVDFAVRYGGEEFAVLLPETKLEEAEVLAERLRQSIAEYYFTNRETQPNGKLTISAGVAGYPNDASSALELVDHADTALYKAKVFRNTIYSYSITN